MPALLLRRTEDASGWTPGSGRTDFRWTTAPHCEKCVMRCWLSLPSPVVCCEGANTMDNARYAAAAPFHPPPPPPPFPLKGGAISLAVATQLLSPISFRTEQLLQQ